MISTYLVNICNKYNGTLILGTSSDQVLSYVETHLARLLKKASGLSDTMRLLTSDFWKGLQSARSVD